MNVKELLLKYGLSSRTALYSRLRVLGIELAKDDNDKAFATPEQLAELDELHDHIKGGNKMSTFVKASKVHVVSNISEQFSVHSTEQENTKNGHLSEQSTVQGTNTVDEAPLKEAIILDRLVGAIINNINPAKSPLDKHRELQESEQNNWRLTTKEIEEIVGKKPRKKKGENYCTIGGWKFVPRGKSGNQNLWSVEKLI